MFGDRLPPPSPGAPSQRESFWIMHVDNGFIRVSRRTVSIPIRLYVKLRGMIGYTDKVIGGNGVTIHPTRIVPSHSQFATDQIHRRPGILLHGHHVLLDQLVFHLRHMNRVNSSQGHHADRQRNHQLRQGHPGLASLILEFFRKTHGVRMVDKTTECASFFQYTVTVTVCIPEAGMLGSVKTSRLYKGKSGREV